MSKVWTLLITDDCQEDREVYREYLSGDPDQSYHFIEAGSAEMGLALCQEQHCDAILLDFRLPDMTGLEFLDELHQQPDICLASLPVIMLTGQGDERVAVQALKRGAHDYLVKQDLEPDLLQLTVRNVLHQSRSQHPVSQSQFSQSPRRLSAEVALQLHQSLDLDDMLYTAVTEVQRILECDRVVVYQVIPDPPAASHTPAYRNAYRNAYRTADAGVYANARSRTNAVAPPRATLTKRCETGLSGPTRDPIAEFLTILAKPSASDSQTESAASSLNQATILPAAHPGQPGDYLLAPILLPSQGPQAWGLLVACHASAHPMPHRQRWQPDEVRFLRDFANQLAIAVYQSERLTQALDALAAEKQLNTLKSQLVARVSHEYRSPLATILAAASTLKWHSDTLPEDKQQHFFHMIETKARQMAHLVEDLLVLEAFEASKMNVVPLPFELPQFISDLIDEQRQSVGERHPLTFKITGNTQSFWGDRRLLRLIVVHLLSNAIKYSTEGGAIEVHLMGTGTHIRINVRDQGIGIPPKEQDLVFQPFTRGSNVGEIPGMGLGLAIVKTCVALHSGEVTLQSRTGKGTQFAVCLPKQPTPNSRRAW